MPTNQSSTPKTTKKTKNETGNENESAISAVADEMETFEDTKTVDGGGGMERGPAPNMLDTDAESERDSETVATPTQLSDVTTSSEVKRNEEDEKSEKEEEKIRHLSNASETRTRSNDDITGSNEASNENGAEFSGSTEDLLAIMGTGEPESDTRPYAMSQCSVVSLDAALGTDTVYFLHFRVVSNSGQR